MKSLPALAMLGVAQFLIFFRDPRHFFIGDSIIWIRHRHQSIAEFLEAFVTVDRGGWYRPLSQRVVPAILHPLVGLDPLAYRVVGCVLFAACTVLLWLLINRLTESSRTAWFAALFFSTHSTHAFVTYDVAFTPELLLFLFYTACAITYLAHLRTGKLGMLWASTALFVCALLSKETAVALPFTLLALQLFGPLPVRRSLRSLIPHFGLLALYLAFAIGYLHVRDIRVAELLERPGQAGGKGYTLVAGTNVIDNLSLAVRWGFGIPKGPQSGDPPMGSRTQLVLGLFRAIIIPGAACVLFTSRRRLMLAGIAWFATALFPTLPLIDHFMPYYLFVPLAGFSLAAAAVLDWMFERLAGMALPLATAPAALLLLMAMVQARVAGEIQERHDLLGQSARNAWNSLNDLKTLHPALPPGATLLVRNEEMPAVDWDQGYGQVFQLGYDDPTISTRYSIDGATVTLDELRRGAAFVMQWSGGRLVDRTTMTLQRPDVFLQPPGPFHAMSLSATTVKSGDSYSVHVPSLRGSALDVLYALDREVQDPFQIALDGEGTFTFTTTALTTPGRYTFLALRRAGDARWSLVDRSITVK